MKKRLLAIDFGHARIGFAISDPLHIIASPLAPIKGSKNPLVAAQYVVAEMKRLNLDIGQIIVGLPLHMDGTESERSAEVRAFVEALKQQLTIHIQLFDERLTTVQAERLMKQAEMSRKQRTPFVDGVSSTILLQSFLDFQGNNPS